MYVCGIKCIMVKLEFDNLIINFYWINMKDWYGCLILYDIGVCIYWKIRNIMICKLKSKLINKFIMILVGILLKFGVRFVCIFSCFYVFLVIFFVYFIVF